MPLTNKGSGISLIELTISLCLSSLLITMLFQYFLHCKQQYQRAEQSLEQFLDLQLISELISDSAKKAGFTPCASINDLVSFDRRNNNLPVQAVTLTSASTITLKRMSEAYTLAKIDSDFQISVDKKFNLDKRYPLIISDCFQAEIHQIKQLSHSIHRTAITLAKPVNATFHAPIYIGQWVEETFHHQLTSHPGFFYKTTHSELLTSVITDFTVRYLPGEPKSVHIYLKTSYFKAINLILATPNAS